MSTHKIPSFQRMNIHSKKRVKNKWRKPRGIDSKQRQKLKAYGAIPDVGYRTALSERDKHPNGLMEVLISNEKQLAGIDAAKNCIRFSATLGKKKREKLMKIVKEKKIKTVN
ncbi:MAG: eL32 family ribosomal protein [Candidatus Micrarchaeota archaeon]|nr:eL32 family ribosomal protein [Candidatus Micrarchaeota archaeon]